MNLKLPDALLPVKDVLIFFFLLFSFHFVYLGWSVGLSFFPVEAFIDRMFQAVANSLLAQSLWVLGLLGVETTLQGATLFANQGQSFVTVAPECTTLKQWLHWVVIMGFFPGPVKHKLWYIPAGILVIHLTNLLRINGLLLLQEPFPGSFHFFHDYVFKPLFYAVIFGMWLFWNEKIRKTQPPIQLRPS